MMTVISEMTIEPGREPEWDAVFRARFDDAPNQPGWVSVQLLIPLDAPNCRVVVGTWQSKADWEAWHETATFRQTREEMDALSSPRGEERWLEVVSMEAAG